MKKLNFLYYVLFAMAFCFIGAGYASLSDELNIEGLVEVTPPVYEELVITDITALSGTSVNSETHTRVIPTNIKTTITGSKGQSIIYRVTTHNYSETDTYVYTGIQCASLFYDVFDKMTLSVSLDESGTQLLADDTDAMSVSGTPVAPGEEFVFYVKYTLDESITAEEILLNYTFKTVKYTITYLNDNEIWAVDCIVNNEEIYYVRTDAPTTIQGQVFVGWINANAVVVKSYPAGNTNNYTLSAKWDKMYLIMFVDESGSILYQEIFTDSSTALSAEGQAIVDEKLAELQVIASADDMSVTWSSYDISSATSDIVVHPIYTYTGMLQFTPIDEDGDGITDYYQLDAVSQLKDPVKIPGKYRGLDVKVVNKLYKNEGNFDFGAGIKTIEIGEGVTTLNHNSLAYTSDLSTVKLPNSLETIGKNAFSRNTIGDQKKLTIEFNGTMAEWKQIIANSHEDWHNGLKDGSVVKCSDGYFELDRGILGLGRYNWKEHSY